MLAFLNLVEFFYTVSISLHYYDLEIAGLGVLVARTLALQLRAPNLILDSGTAWNLKRKSGVAVERSKILTPMALRAKHRV